MEIAEDYLENLERNNFMELARKQADARAEIDPTVTFCSDVELEETEDDIIAYLEDTGGQKYKVGVLEGKKLVFDWRNPEPIQF
jgi:hypothetical protein